MKKQITKNSKETDNPPYTLATLRYAKEKLKSSTYQSQKFAFYKRKLAVNQEILDLLSNSQPEQQQDLFASLEPLKERVLYDVHDKLFSDEYLYKTTDLKPEQIHQFFKVIIIDTLFYKKYVPEDSPLYNKYKNLFDDLLRLSISKNRLSRGEAIQLFQQAKTETEKIKEIQSM